MALIDDVLSTINATLLSNFDWLDNAYGKIIRMKGEDKNGKSITFPGIYKQDTQDGYISLIPDRELGNYCYWEVPDPVGYEIVRPNIYTSFKFKLVFWYKWEDIWPADHRERSIEEVKALILNVLRHAPYTRSVEAFNVYEDIDSIFQNFTQQGYISSYVYKQYDAQFMMRPFGAIAFSGEIRMIPTCVDEVVPPTIPPSLHSLFPLNYSASEQVFWPLKWFGEVVYWRTWSLDTGTNDYENLTGLTTSVVGKIIKTEYRAINGVSGTEENGPIQLDVNGTQYQVFTLSAHTQIYVTVFYTK